MKKNYNIDDIENFLNQEMKTEELAAFEAEMANDETFAEEVDFHADVIKGIQTAGAKDFRQLVAGVHSDLKKEDFFSEKVQEQTVKKEAKVRRLGLSRVLAIAASLALVLFAGWWMMTQQPVTNEQLFASNFTIHQDALSVEVDDRLTESGFGIRIETLNGLKAAMNSYNTGNYPAAIRQFNAFQQAAPQDALANTAHFYKAISLLQTGEIAAAAEAFNFLNNLPNFTLSEDVKWYLALTYLKQEKRQAAIAVLQQLDRSATYKDKAAQLLKKL